MFLYFRQWFLRPILDLEVLNYRLNSVSFYSVITHGLFFFTKSAESKVSGWKKHLLYCTFFGELAI